MEYVRPLEDCKGTMSIKNNTAFLQIQCLSMDKTPFELQIDLSKVSLKDLKNQKEVLVNAKSPFTDNQWLPFNLFLRDKSFFSK